MITIEHYTKEIASQWNEYVDKTAKSVCYQTIEWKAIIEKSCRLKSFYLYAVDENNKICGILPLFLSKSRLFGTYITSIPYFNYGGILADTNKIAELLFQESVKIANEQKASHIELRHIQNNFLPDQPTKTHKIRMLLSLPSTADELWTGFKSKLRSQIKRAQRENMDIRLGGIELIGDFYKVFSRNMRDLGTPVWSKKLFVEIFNELNDKARFSCVYFQNKPVACGLVIGFKNCLEIPFASSLRKYNRLSPNMLLYWSILKFACDSGYDTFDFGRSSSDSNTFRFKQQWGAQPETLHWQYWLPEGESLPEINPQNPKYAFAISMWQKLPVSIANVIGPKISRMLP